MEKVIKYDFELVSHWADLVYACETRPIKLSAQDWCRQHDVDFPEYIEWKLALSLYAYRSDVTLDCSKSQSLERKVRLVRKCKKDGSLPDVQKQMAAIVEQDKATATVEEWMSILEKGERREKGKSMSVWCSENDIVATTYCMYRKLIFLLSLDPEYRDLRIKWKDCINQVKQTKLTATKFLASKSIPAREYYAAKSIFAARLDPNRVSALLQLIENNRSHDKYVRQRNESSQEQLAVKRICERALNRCKESSDNTDPYAVIEIKGVKITLANNVEKADVQCAVDVLQALNL